MKKVLAECIKSYADEDDLYAFENGQIEKNQIKIYEKGCKYFVIEGLYDKNYYRVVKP